MAATPEVDDNEDEAPAAPAAPSLDKAYPSQMAEAARKDAPSADISLGGDDPTALSTLVDDQKAKSAEGEARIAGDQAAAKEAGQRKSVALGGVAKEASVYQKALTDFDMNNPFPQPMVEKWTNPAPSLDPLRAFGNWGTVFGVLASAFTRRPLENAFNAAGAAMAAAHTADVEAWTQNREIWKDNQALAMKQAEWSQKKYEAALNLMATKHDAGMTEWKAVAAMEDNNVALNVRDATDATEYLSRLRTGVNDGFAHQDAMDDYAERQDRMLTTMTQIVGSPEALKNLPQDQQQQVRVQALNRIAQEDKNADQGQMSAFEQQWLQDNPGKGLRDIPADQRIKWMEDISEAKSSGYLKSRDFGAAAGANKPAAILEQRLKAWASSFKEQNGRDPTFDEQEEARYKLVKQDKQAAAEGTATGSGKLAMDNWKQRHGDDLAELARLRESDTNTRLTEKDKADNESKAAALEAKISHNMAMEDTSTRSLDQKQEFAEARMALDRDKLEEKKQSDTLNREMKGTIAYADAARKLDEAKSRISYNEARVQHLQTAGNAPADPKNGPQERIAYEKAMLTQDLATNPNMSEVEKAQKRLEYGRQFDAGNVHMTGNQVAKLQDHNSKLELVMTNIDDALNDMEKTAFSVGFGSKLGKTSETLGNITHLSGDTTRKQIESRIATIKLNSERLLKEGGVFNAKDADLLNKIIRYDSFGDTYANVTKSLTDFQENLHRMWDDNNKRLKYFNQSMPGEGGDRGTSITNRSAPAAPSPVAPGAGYTPSPYARAVQSMENTTGNPAQANLGGDSSAMGDHQFVEGTWLDLAHKNFPETRQMPDDKLLALRGDSNFSALMTDKLAEANAPILKSAGLRVDPATLALAHHFGAGGAIRLVQGIAANPKAMAADIMGWDSDEAKAQGVNGLTGMQVFMQKYEATKSARAGFSLGGQPQSTPGRPTGQTASAAPPPPTPKTTQPAWLRQSTGG